MRHFMVTPLLQGNLHKKRSFFVIQDSYYIYKLLLSHVCVCVCVCIMTFVSRDWYIKIITANSKILKNLRNPIASEQHMNFQ